MNFGCKIWMIYELWMQNVVDLQTVDAKCVDFRKGMRIAGGLRIEDAKYVDLRILDTKCG